MLHVRRALVVVWSAALLLTACGGGGGSGDASESAVSGAPVAAGVTDSIGPPALGSSSAADGAVDIEALDAMAEEFAALDEEHQFDRLNDLSGQLEHDLFALSGLSEELGGTEAVEASITETGQWFADLAVEVRGSVESAELEPQGFRTAAPAQADGVPSIAMGVFGGVMISALGAEAAVSSTNDGRTVSGELGTGVTLEGSTSTAEIATEHTSTDSSGVTTTLKTRNVVTPCPAADGTFTASATVDTSSTINSGATGKRVTLDVEITGLVDDNAGLVGYDTTSRSQYADFVASKGGFFDLTIGIPRVGPASAVINRTGGTVTQEVLDNAVALNRLMLLVAANKLAEAAQHGWESGRCVEVTTSVSAGPKGLTPSASVSVTAAPRSKVDAGAPVGGTVTALLTGGEASVTPSSTPVPADAEFTYVAPDEEDKTGQVSLEARSKRGVGRATIDFDTAGAYSYQIVGGLDDFQTDTAVCDVRSPFALSGGGIEVQFSGGLTGTYSYAGVFAAAGDGEYQITLPDGPGQPGTMVGGGEGTVIGGAAGSGTEHYSLTPITC